MNKKSILYILVVLMTLSLTLSAVSAGDVAADDAAADGEALAIDEDGASDDGASEGDAADESAADDGASEGDAADESAADDGACEDGASEDGASEDGACEDGASEGAADESSSSDPATAKSTTAKPAPAETAAAKVLAKTTGAGPSPAETATVKIADLQSAVKVLYETPFEILWGIYVTNNGPDTADKTIVRIDGSDNLLLYGYLESMGKLDLSTLTWNVGDLLVNETAVLLLDTIKIDYGPYWMNALVVSDSFDPDLSNNYVIGWADVEDSAVSAAEKTMPAAGNPIAMALLALIAIAGTTISRRF